MAWSDVWVPPVEGIKASIEERPTERSAAAQQYAAEVLQQRYERWIAWHYSRILSEMRRTLESLDHIPDMSEVAAIIASYDTRQESVLQRAYLQIYPSAATMVIPDDSLKAVRRYEGKELSLEQQRILEWIKESLGLFVSSMTQTTLTAVEAAARSSFDILEFRDALQRSGAFSTVRARTIAVTETNTMVNTSLDRAADEAARGRETVKTWRTSGRTNVRDAHRMMAGVTIGGDELFHVPNRHGGYDLMLYAGDRAHGAGPENWINCHCKTFKRLKNTE